MSEETPAFGPVMGHTHAKASLASGASGDRLHHGWLFQGPRGVGKVRLALQFAAYLLADGDGGFDMASDAPLARLIETGAHPDFRWIRRTPDDKGKLPTDIPAGQARSLTEFFALRPAMGGWRIAIIDALDELNRFGANALLKTLEEPPPKALLILIAHGEQPVLPTLKSRCRSLKFGSLSDAEMVDALSALGVTGDAARDVAQFAPGRPGRALALASKDARAAVRAAKAAADAGPRLDARKLNAAVSSASKSDVAFEAALAVLADWSKGRAIDAGQPLEAGAWAQAHREIVDVALETKNLNMDKSQAVSRALLTLQKTAGSL